MPDARSEVQIVISGTATGLEAALKEAQAGLSALGVSAEHTAQQTGHTLAAGEHEAAHEATSLGERAKVAAEMVSLLGAESSEQVLKIEGMSHAFEEARHSFGGFGGALAATAGSFALFKGLDFLHESVEAAMEGEHATAAFNAAFAKTPALAKAATESIEEHREQLTRLAIDDSDAMAIMAQAAGRGLDPRLVTENTDAFADLAVAIHTDFGGAVDAVSHGQRGLAQVMRALNLSAVEQQRLMRQFRGATPDERARAILAMVERSRFAGAAEAQAGTAEGKMAAFHTAMKNLQEEVGTALLPAMVKLAEALTHLLEGAERAAAPFGGLANVLKVAILPLALGGLAAFVTLRATLGAITDLIRGRLLGTLAGSAQELVENTGAATDFAAAVRGIPPEALTKATFLPDGAKERWIANVKSVPPAALTTAQFEAAAAEAAAKAEPATMQKLIDEHGALRVPLVLEQPGAQRLRNMKTSGVGVVQIPVEPVLAKDAEAQERVIRSRIRSGIGKITAGVGVALTMTAGFEVANAIFNSVSIKRATVTLPKIQFTAADQARLDAATKALGNLRSQPPQKVTIGNLNPGAIASALGKIHLTANVNLAKEKQLQDLIDALKKQKAGADAYTKALNDLKTHPLKVETHFAAGDLAKMLGEVFLGTLLGNIMGSAMSGVGGKVGDALKNLLPALAGKLGLSKADAAAAAEAAASAESKVLQFAPRGGTPPPAEGEMPPAPPVAGEGVTRVGGGVLAPNYFQMMPVYNKKHELTGWRPKTEKEIAADNKAAGQAAQNMGKWIVGEFVSGGKANNKQALDLGGGVISAFVEGIKHHWPDMFPWIFGGDRPKHGALSIGGHNYPEYVKAGSKVPTAPKGYEYVQTGRSDYPYRLEQSTKRGAVPIPSDFIGRYGGGRLDAHLIAQLQGVVRGAHPAAPPSAHKPQPAHSTTLHVTVNVNGAHHPQDVGREVVRQLQGLVDGAKHAKRRAG
jgi:hypothetical protein